MLLIDRADPGSLWHLDVAALGNEFAFDQLEQRRFADAVAPDKADLGAGGNRDTRRIEKAPPQASKMRLLN